jgi:hypothetical protein
MPKGFSLQCAAGKTARVRLQRESGRLTPGQALVLLPIQDGETDASHVTYRAPLRQALIDNIGHASVVVCEADKRAFKRGIEHLPPAPVSHVEDHRDATGSAGLR